MIRGRNRSRGGGAGFSPADLSNGAAWYNTSDTSTLFADTAGTIPATTTVARINDKFAGGYNLTQATGTRQPVLDTLNGLTTILFDGTNDLISTSNTALSLLLSGAFSIYVAVKPDGFAANNQIVRFGVSGEFNLAYNNNGSEVHGSHITSFVFSTLSLPVNTTDVRIIKLKRPAAGNVTVTVDGVSAASASANDTGSGDFTIGGRTGAGDLNFNGNIAEVIIYSDHKSPADDALIEAYLERWVPP